MGEPLPRYLNRSARPDETLARNRIDPWFAKMPPAAQTDIRRRTHNRKASQYLAAFFEILIHELLVQLGCSIVVHPQTQTTKHPDFFAEIGKVRFYMECAALDPDADSLIQNVYERDLVSKINASLSHEFAERFRIEGASTGKLTKKLSKKEIKKEIIPKIRRLLNKEKPVTIVIPSAKGADDSWIGCFRIHKVSWPVNKNANPQVFPNGFSRGGVINTAKRMRKALADKNSIYGELEHPYIVAVSVANTQLDDEQRALWGLWGPPDQPINTRIKAVWVFRGTHPWNLHRGSACLYINPLVEIEEIPAILRQFTHARIQYFTLDIPYIYGKRITDFID